MFRPHQGQADLFLRAVWIVDSNLLHCSTSSYSATSCITIGSRTYVKFHCFWGRTQESKIVILFGQNFPAENDILLLIDFLKNESELNMMMMTRIFNFRFQSVSNDVAAVNARQKYLQLILPGCCWSHCYC